MSKTKINMLMKDNALSELGRVLIADKVKHLEIEHLSDLKND